MTRPRRKEGGDPVPGERLFRLLMRLHTRSFRARYRWEMIEVFRDGWREEAAGRGIGAVVLFWLRTVRGTLGVAAEQRWEAVGAFIQKKREGTMRMWRGASAIRHAARALMRSPLFGGTAVLILGLGVGAATAIFTVVNGILLEPLPLPDSEGVVIVCEQHPSIAEYCIGSPTTTEDFARRASSLESIGLARGWTFAVTDGDRTLPLSTGIATGDVFRVLKARPAVGRLFTEGEVGRDADVVLLGHEAWTTHFGADPGVVGRTVSLDETPHVVVGVLPAGFDIPTLSGIQLWRPLHFQPTEESRRTWRGFQVLARLGEESDLEAARAELRGIYADLRRETEAVTDEWRLAVMPYKDWVVHDVRSTLLVFLGAVGLLLVIACANVAGLLLVRSARRSREYAVRAALGASRGDLAGGVLVESAILSLGGGVLGFALAWLGTRAFLSMAPAGIPRLENVAVDATVFGFALGVSGVTLLLFGLLPALRTGGSDLADVIRGVSSHASGQSAGLRRGLVVAEIALSVVLLTTAGLLTRSFTNFLSWDPGFQREGLAALSVRFPPGVVRGEPVSPWLARTEEVALGVSGVRTAAFASSIPLFGGRETITYRPEGTESGEAGDLPRARVYDVSPGYFETLGVPLVRGRRFTEGDTRNTAPVLMVNEAFARRHWPSGGAVGRRLTVPPGDWGSEDVHYQVVGVVADVPPLTPGEPTEPEVYRSNRQYARPFPFLLVRADADPGAVARRVGDRILAEVSPDLSVTVRGSMDALVARRLVRPRFDMTLILAFAGVAMMLTLVGIYGVLAFAVVQRNREMGVRLALGSTRGRVVGQVLSEGFRMAAFGVLLGVGGSFAVAGIVSSVVFGVAPTDAPTLAGAAVAVSLLTLGASAVPAFRASRADPVVLLKEE